MGSRQTEVHRHVLSARRSGTAALNPLRLIVIGALIAGLGACGSDSSPNLPTVTVSGTAATGKALANATVTIKDINGKTKTTTTAADGSYSIDVTDMLPPFVAKVELGSVKLVSLSNGGGVANITPLTDLLVAALSKGSSSDFFDHFKKGSGDDLLSDAQIKAAQAAVTEKLTRLGVDPSNISDFIKSAFKVGDASDKVLDQIGTVTGTAGGKSLADIAADLVKGKFTPAAVVSFGDSLSDVGAYAHFTKANGVAGGKFTTNPGPVWTENVAAHYKLTMTPNVNEGYGLTTPTVLGGNGYAQGGSRVTQLQGPGNLGCTTAPYCASTTPVHTQITRYLTANSGKFSGNEVVLMWAGANDIFVANAATASADIATAATDMVAEVKRVTAAGAKYVVVVTLPDMGINPYAASAGTATAGALTALSQQVFNPTLKAGLTGTANVLLVDSVAFFNDLRANAATYGITNSTSPACNNTAGGGSSLFCTPDTLVAANAAQTYAFADGVHPTTIVHKLFADYASKKLDAWLP